MSALKDCVATVRELDTSDVFGALKVADVEFTDDSPGKSNAALTPILSALSHPPSRWHRVREMRTVQRLRSAGWVKDRWEDPEPAHKEGRPPRRYYKLTTEGRARAVHSLQRGRDRSGLSQLLTPPTVPEPEAGSI